MSEAEDVQAIQTYLKNTSTQTSAAVSTCATLDADTRASWDALAARILAYVSQEPAPLAQGQTLRGELNAMMATLKAKGCGDVPELAASAPAPIPAPPPKGTPNPWLGNPLFAILESPLLPWLIIGAVVVFSRKGRR